DAPGDALQLVWQQRRVGGYYDDDRSATFVFSGGALPISIVTGATSGCGAGWNAGGPWPAQRLRKHCAGSKVSDLGTNWHTEYSQVATVVALHQHANGVPSLRDCQHPRRRADTTFETVAPHPGTAAHTTFFDTTGLGTIKRLKCVGRLHVLAVRIIQKIKSLGDDGVGEDKLAAVLKLPLNRGIAH